LVINDIVKYEGHAPAGQWDLRAFRKSIPQEFYQITSRKKLYVDNNELKKIWAEKKLAQI